jgi:hypothetical protein
MVITGHEEYILDGLAKGSKSITEFRRDLMKNGSLKLCAIHFLRWNGEPRQSIEDVVWAVKHLSHSRKKMHGILKIVIVVGMIIAFVVAWRQFKKTGTLPSQPAPGTTLQPSSNPDQPGAEVAIDQTPVQDLGVLDKTSSLVPVEQTPETSTTLHTSPDNRPINPEVAIDQTPVQHQLLLDLGVRDETSPVLPMRQPPETSTTLPTSPVNRSTNPEVAIDQTPVQHQLLLDLGVRDETSPVLPVGQPPVTSTTLPTSPVNRSTNPKVAIDQTPVQHQLLLDLGVRDETSPVLPVGQPPVTSTTLPTSPVNRSTNPEVAIDQTPVQHQLLLDLGVRDETSPVLPVEQTLEQPPDLESVVDHASSVPEASESVPEQQQSPEDHASELSSVPEQQSAEDHAQTISSSPILKLSKPRIGNDSFRDEVEDSFDANAHIENILNVDDAAKDAAAHAALERDQASKIRKRRSEANLERQQEQHDDFLEAQTKAVQRVTGRQKKNAVVSSSSIKPRKLSIGNDSFRDEVEEAFDSDAHIDNIFKVTEAADDAAAHAALERVQARARRKERSQSNLQRQQEQHYDFLEARTKSVQRVTNRTEEQAVSSPSVVDFAEHSRHLLYPQQRAKVGNGLIERLGLAKRKASETDGLAKRKASEKDAVTHALSARARALALSEDLTLSEDFANDTDDVRVQRIRDTRDTLRQLRTVNRENERMRRQPTPEDKEAHEKAKRNADERMAVRREKHDSTVTERVIVPEPSVSTTKRVAQGVIGDMFATSSAYNELENKTSKWIKELREYAEPIPKGTTLKPFKMSSDTEINKFIYESIHKPGWGSKDYPKLMDDLVERGLSREQAANALEAAPIEYGPSRMQKDLAAVAKKGIIGTWSTGEKIAETYTGGLEGLTNKRGWLKNQIEILGTWKHDIQKEIENRLGPAMRTGSKVTSATSVKTEGNDTVAQQGGDALIVESNAPKEYTNTTTTPLNQTSVQQQFLRDLGVREKTSPVMPVEQTPEASIASKEPFVAERTEAVEKATGPKIQTDKEFIVETMRTPGWGSKDYQTLLDKLDKRGLSRKDAAKAIQEAVEAPFEEPSTPEEDTLKKGMANMFFDLTSRLAVGGIRSTKTFLPFLPLHVLTGLGDAVSWISQ